MFNLDRGRMHGRSSIAMLELMCDSFAHARLETETTARSEPARQVDSRDRDRGKIRGIYVRGRPRLGCGHTRPTRRIEGRPSASKRAIGGTPPRNCTRRRRREVEQEVTAEVAILNTLAVALAADSAVTVGTPGNEKIFQGANKIFTLSKHAPVGIMIYGHVEHFGIPWEVLIKDFRSRLGKQKYPLITDYAEK